MPKTTTAPQAQENHVTVTADQIHAAEEAADAARARARELQAQADAHAAEKAAKADAARELFDTARAENYKADFLDRIKIKREAFEEAVAAGEGITAAWISYMTAVRAAGAEERINEHAIYGRKKVGWDALVQQVQAWLDELALIREKATTSPPKTANQYGDWVRHIPGLTAQQMARAAEAKTRLEQINAEINAVAQSIGSTIKRAPDDTAWLSPYHFTDPPKAPSMTAGETDRWEKRTMTQAINDVVNTHIDTEARKYTANREAAFQKFMAEQG